MTMTDVSFNIESGWEKILGQEAGHNTQDTSVWATRKLRKEKGSHIKLIKSGNQVTSNCDTDGVTGYLLSTRVLNLSWNDHQVTFLAPQKTFKLTKNITSISVSKSGLGLITAQDKAYIFETQDGTIRREFTEHLAEIYCGKLFASGVVAMTGSADMRIKIWSIADGKCPVTLTGHTQAITSVDMIERGRNIISSSKDGNIKLWNCGGSKCTASVETGEILNSCCVVNLQENEDVHLDDTEAIQHKVVVAAGQQASLFFINLQQNKVLHKYKCESAVNVVHPTSNSSVLVGCEDGSLLELDCSASLLYSNHSSSSPVTALLHLRSGLLLCGRQDGTCTLYNNNNHTKQIILSGSDCDKITGVCKDDEYVFTSSREGVVRKYLISNLLL